jgi:hypothetical protein
MLDMQLKRLRSKQRYLLLMFDQLVQVMMVVMVEVDAIVVVMNDSWHHVELDMNLYCHNNSRSRHDDDI